MDRNEKRAAIDDAKQALRERRLTPAAALALVGRLKKYHLFDYACRILAVVRRDPLADNGLRVKLAQEHAVCTYKDQDQPIFGRLDAALAILCEVEDLASTANQETLGITGSIYKQRWLVEGQKQHLERAFTFYDRGHRVGPLTDGGYTGINASFVLDLLAELETELGSTELAAMRRHRASEIRREIAVGLGSLHTSATVDSYWLAVTVGEAYFGLREYRTAAGWFQRARTLQRDGWQLEATARQLARLALIQERVDKVLGAAPQARMTVDPAGMVVAGDVATPAAGPAMGPFDVLRDFLDLPEDVIRAVFLGKIGLALSGGGFRASLFHIGVLARLAEQDILRRVEVLSCVSGGSIIGAHYYLELRRLLQEKSDDEITRQDYIELVGRVARDFLAGVQTNIRVRAVSNLLANVRMIFSPNYSRTHRLGELYEKQLFSRVADDGRAEARYLDALVIEPRDTPAGFHPRWDNWKRRAKVPQLVLNATALNTGHLWQFTASYMGEPASCINAAVDGNSRLRRMYYDDAPPPFRRIRLGHAVAASSCVPGLFEPLQFRGLYPNISVSLVDGGVHDNQGLVGLFEQGCDNVIVSDASGQMDEAPNVGAGFVSALSRSNSVLQARLRDANFANLDVRTRSSAMRATILHLKHDLGAAPRDWEGCDDPKERENPAHPFLRYGVRRDVQQLLARVRTDLDSFSDAEAFALMTSGYRMTDCRLDDASADWPGLQHQEASWPFRGIERTMTTAATGDRLLRILQVASAVPFKAWRLVPALRYASGALAATLAAVLWWVYGAYGSTTLGVLVPAELTVGSVLVAIAGAVAALAAGGAVGRLLQLRGIGTRVTLGIGIALVGWLIALVHLRIFDPLYLAYGRRDKFHAGTAPP